MNAAEIKSQMSADDIGAVTALLDTAVAADGRPALSDHLRLDLDSGGGAGFAGLIVRKSEGGDVYAYAQISAGNESSALELVVHPDHRDGLSAISAELVQKATDIVSAQGGGYLNWWVSEPTSIDLSVALDAGMRLDRTLLQMRTALPTGREVTVETRAFIPGSDEEPWLRVNNRAFADHGEQGGWTLDTLRQRQLEPWFDADGFRIHTRDGRMAAFCWTKIHSAVAAGDPDLGEIYVIAVDPDFAGLGLGTQLTLAGLEYLERKGISTGLLYVDSSNATAVRMYERLGFVTHSTNAAYIIDVVPTSEAGIR